MPIDTKARKGFWLASTAALIFAALLSGGRGAGNPATKAALYMVLMFLPGSLFYLALTKRRSSIEFLLHSLLVSPLLLTVLSSLALSAGASIEQLPLGLLLFVLLAWLTILVARKTDVGTWEIGGRDGFVLLLVTVLFVAVTAYLPLTSQWWRMRSDAWFHAAVIRQIEHGGIPPEDPYFAGMPLQYMWFYHVLVMAISHACNVDPFLVMALLNIQFLVAFILATLLFSMSLGGERGFGAGIASILTVLLALNGLFWLFLPTKIVRAFVGEVRGWEEMARIFSLSPLDIHTVRSFLSIHLNQVFLLDKFMVATAFTMALSYMGGAWYALTEYLRSGRGAPLILAAGLGLWGFHSAAGLVVDAGFLAALAILYMRKDRVNDFDGGRLAKAALLLFLAPLLLSPYLYSIVHAKKGPAPIGFSLDRIIGYFISVAMALFLGSFAFRSLASSRRMFSKLLLPATAAMTVVCFFLKLPGANAFNKPPFFIFYPLAVLGGWTIHGWYKELREKHRTGIALALCAFLLLPVNTVALLGYYNTPEREIVSASEKEAARWVEKNTARDAVFIDDWQEPFLLVEGPRRYYFGSRTYAKQWAYDPAEMNRRKALIEDLYSHDGASCESLRALTKIEHDVYAIARTVTGGERMSESAPFDRFSDIFERAYSNSSLAIFKVNKDAVAARCGDSAP